MGLDVLQFQPGACQSRQRTDLIDALGENLLRTHVEFTTAEMLAVVEARMGPKLAAGVAAAGGFSAVVASPAWKPQATLAE